MKNKIFSVSLTVVATFLSATCFYYQTYASTISEVDKAPMIYVTESHITKTIGNEMQGEFSVLNSESYYLSDLNYEIKLFQGTKFEDLKLIDLVIPADTFFVAPGAKITKTFKYTYPKNIISGDYTLRIQIITSKGTELGWSDSVTAVKGAGRFLDILSTSSKVLVSGASETQQSNLPTDATAIPKSSTSGIMIINNSSASTQRIGRPLEGVAVASTDDVVGYLKVKNSGDAITVIPQIKIYERQFNMPIVKEYQDSTITFAKGETRDVKLTMPKLDIPESYLAEVKFFESGNQVSGIQYFRWVVQGDSGKIIYIKTGKDFYKAGENIDLTVQFVGPADGSDGGMGQLEVSVSDKNGKFITKVLQDVSLGQGLASSLISVPVKSDLTSPVIDVKLIKSGKVLDEQKINLPMFSSEAEQLEKDISKKNQFNLYLIYSLIIVVVILVACFIFYKFKKSQVKN